MHTSSSPNTAFTFPDGLLTKSLRIRFLDAEEDIDERGLSDGTRSVKAQLDNVTWELEETNLGRYHLA